MTWTLIRVSGLAAYAFLAVATVWGLLLSTKLLGRKPSPKVLTYAHESLSVAALLATVVHVVFLTLDEFVSFGLVELLVPGASAYRPMAVALGIVALYALFLIIVSFYVRRRIGQRVWRSLHYGSFGVFVATMVHGIMAGTDSGTVFAIVLYGASAGAVGVLLMMRVALLLGSAAGESAPARPALAAVPSPPAEEGARTA